MVLLGLFAIGTYSYQMAKKRCYNESKIIITLLISAIGVFLGSHLLYAVVNYKAIRSLIQDEPNNNSFTKFFPQVVLMFGGSVFYGGLIGGIIAVYMIKRKNREELKYQLDVITPGIPLFHFFGRIGCFLAGCCFGKPCAFGFTFTHSLVEESNGLKRFPVQILEAFLNLILFFILSRESTYRKFKGNMPALYLLIYSSFRFITEFFRGDEYRGIWLSLSTSQWISVILCVLSATILLGSRRTLYEGTS